MLARQNYQQTLQIYKGTAQQHFDNGMRNFNQGNFAEALQHWQMARETYDLIDFDRVMPQDKITLCNDLANCNWYLAKVYEEFGEHGKAMSYYQAAFFIKQIPDPLTDQDMKQVINYRIDIANAYLKDNKLTEAIKEFIEIVNYLEESYPQMFPEFNDELALGFATISQALTSDRHKITFSEGDLSNPNLFNGLFKLIDIFENKYGADLCENELNALNKLKKELNPFKKEDPSPSYCGNKKDSNKFFKLPGETTDKNKDSLSFKSRV